MKIALAALFAATVATTTGSAFCSGSSATTCGNWSRQVFRLRVELDKSYPLRAGTRIQGHLTEPVYLIDHVAIPANSKVYGAITREHSVSRQVRTAAMFNGDLTPLKNVGCHLLATWRLLMAATSTLTLMPPERTSKVVRMAAP